MVAANMAVIAKAMNKTPPVAIENVVRQEVAEAMEANTNKLQEIKKFIVELARK